MIAIPALSGSSDGWSCEPPSGKMPTAFPAASVSYTAENIPSCATRGEHVVRRPRRAAAARTAAAAAAAAAAARSQSTSASA